MDKQTWLKWRKIGSSDAATIMGVNPYETPYELWQRIISGEEKPETYAMRRGKTLEPLAVAYFEKKTGYKVDQQKCLSHPTHGFMTATLDGIDENKMILLEVKSPMNLLKPKEIPENHFPQVQHQIEVVEKFYGKKIEKAFYLEYDETESESVILETEYDQKYVEKMIKKESEFWDSLLNWEEPELTERDYKQMEYNEQWKLYAQELVELKKEIARLSDLEKREKELRELFIELSGDRNAQGYGVKLTRSLTKGLVDYDKIIKQQNIDKEQFRKKSYYKYRLTAI